MNSNAIVILVVVATVSAAAATVSIGRLTPGLAQQVVRAKPTLDKRIRRADRRRYEAVPSEKDWRNPFMLLTDRGLELRSLSRPEPRVVAVTDLREALAALPVSDWPYGRVAVLQSPGIGSTDPASIAAVERNQLGAREILRALGVEEWGWPA
jgi:hypothetical protein